MHAEGDRGAGFYALHAATKRLQLFVATPQQQQQQLQWSGGSIGRLKRFR